MAVANFRPALFRNDGLNDPSQVQSPVMEDTKKDIGGNACLGMIKHGEKIAGGRLDEFLFDDALHRGSLLINFSHRAFVEPS